MYSPLGAWRLLGSSTGISCLSVDHAALRGRMGLRPLVLTSSLQVCVHTVVAVTWSRPHGPRSDGVLIAVLLRLSAIASRHFVSDLFDWQYIPARAIGDTKISEDGVVAVKIVLGESLEKVSCRVVSVVEVRRVT
jgi:hypothetical protein